MNVDLIQEVYFFNKEKLDSKDQLEFNQLKLIKQYYSLDEDERLKYINILGSWLVVEYLNGDGTNLKIYLGLTGGKGYLNEQELVNVERDFWLGIKKKKAGEIKYFFLLDLLPMSSRMADAIVIDKENRVRLFDFTSGEIAEKLDKFTGDINDLPEKQKSQLLRKERQKDRIDSFEGKILDDFEKTEKLKLPYGEANMIYYTANNVYDIDKVLKEYINDNTLYGYDSPIKNTFCFFSKPNIDYEYCMLFPLKGNIDDPIYIHGDRMISHEVINFIYKTDISIAFNLGYFLYFIEEFTNFKFELLNKMSFRKGMIQLEMVNKKGHTKGVFLRDKRTKCIMPLTYGFIHKHVYRNIDAYELVKYLSYACNIKVKHKYNDYKKFCNEIILDKHCDIWD